MKIRCDACETTWSVPTVAAMHATRRDHAPDRICATTGAEAYVGPVELEESDDLAFAYRARLAAEHDLGAHADTRRGDCPTCQDAFDEADDRFASMTDDELVEAARNDALDGDELEAINDEMTERGIDVASVYGGDVWKRSAAPTHRDVDADEINPGHYVGDGCDDADPTLPGAPLHLVAWGMRFVPGVDGERRDLFEVIDNAGVVIATVYVAASVVRDPGAHILVDDTRLAYDPAATVAALNAADPR